MIFFVCFKSSIYEPTFLKHPLIPELHVKKQHSQVRLATLRQFTSFYRPKLSWSQILCSTQSVHSCSWYTILLEQQTIS